MRRAIFCYSVALAAIGCVGWSGQDQNGVVRSVRLEDGAMQHLGLDGGTPSPADLAAARSDIRASNCQLRGILRRNGIDAGADIPCPTP